MNFVFISPSFPENYDRFCSALKANGVNVLGIAETPYEQLSPLLRESLSEYYRVDSLHDYDQMVRALGYFTFRHGKIDFLESNNEYWLEQDARLREDFHITSGFFPQELEKCKFKSRMKAYYQKAGVPTARYQMADTLERAYEFVAEVGYPIIAKPDNGVGACNKMCIRDRACALSGRRAWKQSAAGKRRFRARWGKRFRMRRAYGCTATGGVKTGQGCWRCAWREFPARKSRTRSRSALAFLRARAAIARR